MKIIFFGNTKYSVIDEKAIFEKFGIALVVTIPDHPSGRRKEIKPSPVKQFAKDNNIPILETDKLDEKTIDKISKIKPDFLVVADYGLILPESLLEIPRFAPLNVHHSLLPKYRGPSPAPTTILNGEKVSGVTVISMTRNVDAGNILAQKEYELAPNETTDSLLTALNKLGGDLAVKVIEDFIKGNENPIPQNDKQASYTKRFTKEDGYFDIASPPDPQTFDRMVRAFYPWPGVWTEIETKRPFDFTQGKLRDKVRKYIKVKFLPQGKIQPEGKRSMTIKEFLNGYPHTKSSIEKLFN